MTVVHMINNNASKCHRCMYILRILTLNGLLYNRRVTVKYVKSKDNVLSDALSRLNWEKVRRFGPEMNKQPDNLNDLVKPASVFL